MKPGLKKPVSRWTLWALAGALAVAALFWAVRIPQVSAFLLYLETGKAVATGEEAPPTQGQTLPSQPAGEEKLTLSRYDATLSYMGESFSISTGDAPKEQVKWSTEDGTVATVFDGQVTGVGRGTTYIFAQYGNQTHVCVVRCDWKSLALEEGSVTLTAPGATRTLTLDRTNLPGNVALRHLKWTSDDPSVATVREGIVTAVGQGTTVIRASFGDESVSCAVVCQWEDTTTPSGEVSTEPSAQTQRLGFDASDVSLVHAEGFSSEMIEEALLASLDWDLTGSQPAVLLYHSHSNEGYEDVEGWYTSDPSRNVVAVGERIAARLEAAGIRVIHDTTPYDTINENSSYTNSHSGVESYLERYPSICLVLDLHRDSATHGDPPRQFGPTCLVEGQSSAKLMIFLSDVHAGWKENLSIAAKLHAQLERMYSGIMRPIQKASESVLHAYNQDLSGGAMLIEVGFAGNSLSQAGVAADALADAILALKNGAN